MEADQGDGSCQRCGRSVEAQEALCSNCADHVPEEPSGSDPAETDVDPLPPDVTWDVTWEEDLRRDAETTWWSHLVGGVLLMVGSVAIFFLGLILLGGFGAWLGGIMAFTMGSLALAYFFGGHKAGQSL